MPAPEGLTQDLQFAWENAWTSKGDGTPPGVFIGAVKTAHTTFYFYKEGANYWYENDYDREVRAKREVKRKRERDQRGNGYGGYYGRR